MIDDDVDMWTRTENCSRTGSRNLFTVNGAYLLCNNSATPLNFITRFPGYIFKQRKWLQMYELV